MVNININDITNEVYQEEITITGESSSITKLVILSTPSHTRTADGTTTRRLVCNGLKKITISTSSIESIELGSLADLKEADLKEINIIGCTSLKDLVLNDLTNLENLNIIYCHSIKSIFFGTKVNLKEIKLESCQALTNLGLSNLKKLKKLDITSCGIKSIEFGIHHYLKEITLASCQALENLVLSNLSKLIKLHISSCGKIEYITLKDSEEITIIKCPKLKELEIHICTENLTILNCDNLKKVFISSLELPKKYKTSRKIKEYIDTYSVFLPLSKTFNPDILYLIIKARLEKDISVKVINELKRREESKILTQEQLEKLKKNEKLEESEEKLAKEELKTSQQLATTNKPKILKKKELKRLEILTL